jgi:hypothetical protein
MGICSFSFTGAILPYLPLTSNQVFFKCAFRQSLPSILPSILVLDFSTFKFNGLPMGLKTSLVVLSFLLIFRVLKNAIPLCKLTFLW